MTPPVWEAMWLQPSIALPAIYSITKVSYPFFDDMESGEGTWEWGTPWGLEEDPEDATNTCWTDSPSNNKYGNNANICLTTCIDLSRALSPVLTFREKHFLEYRKDYGYVQVSINGGKNWNTLLTVTGTADYWSDQRLDLSAYAGQSMVLRFRLTSNEEYNYDGWYIDDVRVDEGIVVNSYPFSDDCESGVGGFIINSPWGLTDVLSHNGTYSWSESPQGPYSDNMDTSLYLNVDLSTANMPTLTFWQRYILGSGDYGCVEVSKDGGTSWKRLSYVIGSSNEITGNEDGWVEERIDLSEYAGAVKVTIRFRFVSDGSDNSGGWNIDDIAIGESEVTMPYPFFDSMDNEQTRDNWCSSSWEIYKNSHSGLYGWTDSPMGNYLLNAYVPLSSSLTLAGTIDLSDAVHPQLIFWHHYDMYYYNSGEYNRCYGLVQISKYCGQTWDTLWDSRNYSTDWRSIQSAWAPVQLDLSNYVGLTQVRIRFLLFGEGDYDPSHGHGGPFDGWYIDDVRIEESPQDVTMFEPDNVTMRGAQLSWTPSSYPTFSRYEIYRSTSASVNRSSTLVATINDQQQTGFDDIYTIMQPDYYYYRIYVIDENNTYSAGSNVVKASYSIPKAPYPFFDDMESGADNWEWVLPWGLAEDSADATNICWTDSPTGNYGNNANTRLTTLIDLSTASYPVLTFRQRYSLEYQKDYGYVQVSVDGGKNWSNLLSVTGMAYEWSEQRINLSGYARQSIVLRFRLTSSEANTYDGWYIDDVRIAEGFVANAYPFSDNCEEGVDHFYYDSPWGLSRGLTDGESHSGSYSWTESPQGVYSNNMDTSLYLRVDLSTAEMPILTYWQRYSLSSGNYSLSSGDYGCLEVSTDGGSSWKRLSYVVGLSTGITGNENGWVRERIDLAEYVHYDQVTIRFRFVSDGSGISDGWKVDDIAIGEPEDTISYPFIDSMDNEQTKANWCSSSWELYTDKHSGLYGWTDSPGGNYLLNSYIPLSSSLTMASTIDLSRAKQPQLIFWHHYDMYYYNHYDHNRCYGLVQISAYCGQLGTWDNISEKPLWDSRNYLNTSTWRSTQSEWTRVQIDLSKYAGLRQVRIRFLLVGEGDYYPSHDEGYGHGRTFDGWYIDDVYICELPGSTGPVDWCSLARPSGVIAVPGQPTPLIYGQVYEPGITDRPGQGEGIIAQLGCGPVDSTPDSTWIWVNADYSSDAGEGEYDEYAASLTVSTGGSYHYAYRFSMNNGETWIYADLNGNDTGSGGSYTFTSDQAGELSVMAELSRIEISPDRLATANNTQIQFTATGYDTLGQAIPDLGNITWQVNGPIGTIDNDGLFTATNIGLGTIIGSIESNGLKKDTTSIIEVISRAGGLTQNEGGRVYNSGGLQPSNESLLFNAYISTRPTEILTQDSPGCDYSNGEWGINIGNLQSAWSSGETLTIDFIDAARGEVGRISYTLQAGGQSHDITLESISFSLLTTPTTDINCIVLVKDAGVKDAEGLVSNIPNANEIAYWDTNNQCYIGHTKGSGLFNFPVTPGNPYYVTVSADTVWTPTGNVPDPWPDFNLITTRATDVNMIGLPLTMMRLVQAQEVCQVIPDVKEVAFWDTSAQSYGAHTKDTPFNNFSVYPGMALFLTMADRESGGRSRAKTLPGSGALQQRAGGVTQNEGGYLTSLDGSIPSDGDITFSAYIEGREGDILTQSSPGCGYGSGYWQVNIGNFSNPWDAGDILKLSFQNIRNGEIGEAEIIIQYGGQQTNIRLYPPSYWVDDDADGAREVDGDCDDDDNTTYPWAPELCDGRDNDCNGAIPANEADTDNDGSRVCEGDCDDGDATIYPGAIELCDGKDNDCNGAVPGNETDADKDGVRVCQGDCDDGNATIYPGAIELCDGKDNDCNGTIPENEADADKDGVRICQGDCNDGDATTYPGAKELCDGRDNDCNGVIPLNEADADKDGVLVCKGDCDDSNATIYPGAIELCDGRDNDCNGIIPENEADADEDGVMVCEDDCDDDDETIYPGAPEYCDDKDNDCDEQIDKAGEAGCIEDITVEIELNQGWNLVSLPVKPADATVRAIFPKAWAVFKFDFEIGYILVKPADELEMGAGYWVWMDKATTCAITGKPVASLTMTEASATWLLIGPCSYVSKLSVDNGTIEAAFDFKNITGNKSISVSSSGPGKGIYKSPRYRALLNMTKSLLKSVKPGKKVPLETRSLSFDRMKYNYIFIGTGSTIGLLEPGHGYWIKLSKGANITIEAVNLE